MGNPINLMERIKQAKIISLDKNTPFEPALYEVLRRITPSVLDRLSTVSYRQVEIILESVFEDIANISFFPNGERRAPDMAFEYRNKSWWVEWKSAANFGSNFQFNDSLPRGYIYYLFFSRKERQYIMIRGDDLLYCINRDRIEHVYNNVQQMRVREKQEYGSRRKKNAYGVPPASTLIKFTPRMNGSIQNFLCYAQANGFFDLDQSTIWCPRL